MASEVEYPPMTSEVNKNQTLPLSTKEEAKPKVEGKIPNGKINHINDENGRITRNHSREQDNYKMGLMAQCTCACGSDVQTCVEESSEQMLCESVKKVHIEQQFQEDINEMDGISYTVYESEKQMPDIMRLITKDLSEPYSIYTYRYFIHNWPKLCFLVSIGGWNGLIYIFVPRKWYILCFCHSTWTWLNYEPCKPYIYIGMFHN
jgi:hypothetical protein